MNAMNEIIEVFPWNENFATGIPQIDEQHKRLVHLLNMLACGLAYQADSSELNRIFNELSDYAVYHFATEEKIWRQFLGNDPLEADHEKSHEKFVTDVLTIKAADSSKNINEILKDVLSFLTHWLAFHILESDKRLSKVVAAMQAGIPLEQAKFRAEQEMSGAIQVLIETVLAMYDSLSNRTLQLIKEVIHRQKAEAKLRLAANAVQNTLEAICITDAEATVIEANPAFHQITQLAFGEVVGKSLRELKSGLEDEILFSEIWGKLAEQGHWSGEVKSRLKSGEIYTDWLTLSSIKNAEGAISNYVAVFSNFSRLAHQWHELKHLANHDALTGLPNRLLLSDRLDLAIAHAERTGSFLAVCYLDLDGFKPINDQFGHAAGDLVLREIARRLKEILRGNDTVSRIGGDEFVILLGDLNTSADFKELLERVLNEIALPIQIGSASARVSGSIGVTQYPQDNSDSAELIQHADAAMYQAKRMGKSRYHLAL